MKAPINSSKTRPKHFLLDAMTAGASNAIEMQESQGQHSFVGSDTLPTDGRDRAALESFGERGLQETQTWMATLSPRPEIIAVSSTVWGVKLDGKMICAPTIEEAARVLREALERAVGEKGRA